VRCGRSGGVVSSDGGALEEQNHMETGSSVGPAMVQLDVRALARASAQGGDGSV